MHKNDYGHTLKGQKRKRLEEMVKAVACGGHTFTVKDIILFAEELIKEIDKKYKEEEWKKYGDI